MVILLCSSGFLLALEGACYHRRGVAKMNMQIMKDGLSSLFEWIMLLAYINVLWIVFTIIGMGILGWAPATAASFAVIRKLILTKGDEDRIFYIFQKNYKKEFIHANILGWLMLLSVFMIFMSGVVMKVESSILPKIILGIVAFLISVIIIFIFPVFCHFQTSLLTHIRYSLMIGVAHLHYFLFFIITLLFIYYLYSLYPVIMVFYLISLPASILMYFSLKIFHRIQKTV